MTVFFLNCPAKSFTGGHKYNDDFMSYLSSYTGWNIVRTPNCALTYPSFRKFYAPFAELKWLKRFQSGDIVFLYDSCSKYHFLLALLANLFCGVSLVSIIHHFQYLERRKTFRFFHKFIQYVYFRTCDFLIVPSPFTLSISKKLFTNTKIVYVPIPFEKNFSISSRYEKGSFLFVGTVEPRKGLAYLIEAIGKVKMKKPNLKIHLNIVGKIVDSDYYNKLLLCAMNSDVRDVVKFWNRVPEDLLNDMYNKADLFIFPSLLEGYGMVLIEAMSHGIPVVAFNNSAMPYTIQDGVNGLLANDKDAESLAEKILLICGNDSLRMKLQLGMKATVNDLKTRSDFEEGVRQFVRAVRI